MTTKRTGYLSVLILFVLLIGWAAVQGQEQAALLIGVMDEETSAAAHGAQLAANQINDAGGLLGADGVNYRIEIVIEPTDQGTRFEEAVAVLGARGVAAVIGPENAGEVRNNLALLQSLNVPVFTSATDDTLLAEDTGNFLVRTRAADVVQAQALASHIIHEFGFTQIIVVQLDAASETAALPFRTAAEAFGVPTGSAMLTDPAQLAQLTEQLVQANSDVLVVFGSPSQAGVLFRDLRFAGWEGLYAYNELDNPNFRAFVPPDLLEGIIGAATWTITRTDAASVNFLYAYIRSFGELPNAVAAAAFDAVQLIAQAAAQPGSIREEVLVIDAYEGVQGSYMPASLSDGDLTTSVTIVRLGIYGAPEVLARYVSGVLLPPDETLTVSGTPIPEGVYITITGEVQNVRRGPSLSFDVLGQLRRGDVATVIGTDPDEAWVIIDFQGEQGWLAAYLLDITGDLSDVPIIAPPPTATPPPPTATFTPSPEPDIVIDSVTAIPAPIIPGQPFNLAVTVRNAGITLTGSFVVSSQLAPNNIIVSTVVPPLSPGQSFVANMAGTLTNTGFYSATVIADAQNQVLEGAQGEGNNSFPFNYTVDRTTRRSATQTLNLGDTIDLEGDAVEGDANWNADGAIELDGLFGAKLGILPGTDINQIHWDLINPAGINRDSIPRTELNVGTLIGIITADGARGVMRVDGVSDTTLIVTFRVYNQ